MKIAPLKNGEAKHKPWEGLLERKPWDYAIQACIPTLGELECLQLCIELLRLQTVPPYIVVVDTGSSEEDYRALEMLRAPDLEIHSIRGQGYKHPSDPVAHAMDLCFSLARSPYCFATHSDCFLRSRTVLERLLEICQAGNPIVGYRMSPRDHADWDKYCGHTCTLYDMETMDRLGVTWSQRRFCRLMGIEDHKPDPRRPNFPDTELCLGYLTTQAGIQHYFIGYEENYNRNKDDNIDHIRSLVCSSLYDKQHYRKCGQWLTEAKQEARQRIATWSGNTIPGS